MKSMPLILLVVALVLAALFYASSLDDAPDGEDADGTSDAVGEAESPDERIIFPEDLPKSTPLKPKHAYVPPGSVPELAPDATWHYERQVDYAIADIVRGLGLDTDQGVYPAAVMNERWPSAALGCPDPDMMYAAVVSPGKRIVFEIDGVFHAYHSTPDGVPFYCPPDRTQPGLR